MDNKTIDDEGLELADHARPEVLKKVAAALEARASQTCEYPHCGDRGRMVISYKGSYHRVCAAHVDALRVDLEWADIKAEFRRMQRR